MPLDEAEDASYSINLPDEDPIQFERPLTYMYRGTWESDAIDKGNACSWDHAETGRCACWNHQKYMQLYASACKYTVSGLTAKIAPKLDLKEAVLPFCDAFKYA